MKTLICLTVSILLLGCSPDIKFMRYTEKAYTPSTNVEVLRVKPVTKEFIEIGEISVQMDGSEDENAIIHLKQKAKEIGADAIIILGVVNQGAVGVPAGTMTVFVPINYLNSVAIKYK